MDTFMNFYSSTIPENIAQNDSFSIISPSDASLLSMNDFTIVCTINNDTLRQMEHSMQQMNHIAHNQMKPISTIDAINLTSMKPGDSLSLMYWMNVYDYLDDMDSYIDDYDRHIITDSPRLTCFIHKDRASPQDIMTYANEFPHKSINQRLIKACGTASCIGVIMQIVSFGLLNDNVFLCERPTSNKSLINRPSPLITRIHQVHKNTVFIDASKILSCCKIGIHGAMEYGTCTMHIFRDTEDPSKMALLADIVRLPTALAGSHDLLSPFVINPSSNVFYDSIHNLINHETSKVTLTTKEIEEQLDILTETTTDFCK